MDKIVWKKIHNALGLLSALLLLILLVTGLLLNHPSSLKRNEIHTLSVDPSNSRRIFAGRPDGLYYSADEGNSWDEVPMLYSPQEVVDIAYSPDNPRQIYVLEKWGKIFFSHDGGTIWNAIRIPFDPQAEGIELKKLSIGRNHKLVLLTSNGWLSSMDSGESWDLSHFDKNKRTLHQLILTVHNGYFFGPAFVWLYDFASVALLILIVSGMILWNIGRSAG